MLVHLFIAGAILALIVGVGEANADPQPEPMLVPPVSLACISSPLGPRLQRTIPGRAPTIRVSIFRRRRTRSSLPVGPSAAPALQRTWLPD
jgi:hypothetical protein